MLDLASHAESAQDWLAHIACRRRSDSSLGGGESHCASQEVRAPAELIYLDIETYYDDRYSLSHLSVEAYIRHPQFMVHGVGIKHGGQSCWLDHQEFVRLAGAIEWSCYAVVCHNAFFDAAVLAWTYGIHPKQWMDTLGMARASYPQRPSYSLDALAQAFGLGHKGGELASVKGLRLLDTQQRANLGRYCLNDVDLLESLHQHLVEGFPEEELALIDCTIRQYVEPTLVADTALLKTVLIDERHKKQSSIDALGVQATELRSKAKFTEKLKLAGVDFGSKVSLSRKNPEFMALLHHHEPLVRGLVEARLLLTSNIEETRAQGLLDIGGRGAVPVLLNYYGAATGRFSGGGGINLQNLPRSSSLRRALCAPPGHCLVSCDSSQIEARVLAYFAGESALLQSFREQRDIYCDFASQFYARPITKADSDERRLGKTAILGLGYGMGVNTFATNLKNQGIDLPLPEVRRLVQVYRKLHPSIHASWAQSEKTLRDSMVQGGRRAIGVGLSLPVNGRRIELPNGLALVYPGLRESGARGRLPPGLTYQSAKGEQSLYGGKIIENVIQALARIIVMGQLLQIAERYRVVFSVHDEVVCCVPESESDSCLEYMKSIMSLAPSWAIDLPLACEGTIGRNYGEVS